MKRTAGNIFAAAFAGFAIIASVVMLTVVYLFFTVPSSGDVSNSFLFETFVVEARAVNNGGISAELGFENSFSFFLVWLVLSVISFFIIEATAARKQRNLTSSL